MDNNQTKNKIGIWQGDNIVASSLVEYAMELAGNEIELVAVYLSR